MDDVARPLTLTRCWSAVVVALGFAWVAGFEFGSVDASASGKVQEVAFPTQLWAPMRRVPAGFSSRPALLDLTELRFVEAEFEGSTSAKRPRASLLILAHPQRSAVLGVYRPTWLQREARGERWAEFEHVGWLPADDPEAMVTSVR